MKKHVDKSDDRTFVKSDNCVFTAFITLKNGKRIYARSYGLKAFCFKKKQ